VHGIRGRRGIPILRLHGASSAWTTGQRCPPGRRVSTVNQEGGGVDGFHEPLRQKLQHGGSGTVHRHEDAIDQGRVK
jgi:hypothetical protein